MCAGGGISAEALPRTRLSGRSVCCCVEGEPKGELSKRETGWEQRGREVTWGQTSLHLVLKKVARTFSLEQRAVANAGRHQCRGAGGRCGAAVTWLISEGWLIIHTPHTPQFNFWIPSHCFLPA